MTYNERVPPPLDDDGTRRSAWAWWLIAAGVAVVVYLLWRSGAFSKAGAETAKIASGPANPFGWR